MIHGGSLLGFIFRTGGFLVLERTKASPSLQRTLSIDAMPCLTPPGTCMGRTLPDQVKRLGICILWWSLATSRYWCTTIELNPNAQSTSFR